MKSLIPCVLLLLSTESGWAVSSDSTKLDSAELFDKLPVILNTNTQTAIKTAKKEYFYKSIGGSHESESYYKRRFESYGTLESASAALHLSNLLYQREKYTEALKYANYAVEKFNPLGLSNKKASTYLILAAINRKLGAYKKAETYILKQALPLFKSMGDKNGRLNCFDELGNIYFDQKKYSQAKWFFIQQNTLSRVLKDTLSIINSLYYLGNVKVAIKDYDLALADFEEADKLAQSAGLKINSSTVIMKSYNKMEQTEPIAHITESIKSKNKFNRFYMKIPNANVTLSDNLLFLYPKNKRLNAHSGNNLE